MLRFGIPLLAGLAVTWLGTSSGAPTLKRNVSCIAVRLPSSTFLVDCGEGSCRQVRLNQPLQCRQSGIICTCTDQSHHLCEGCGSEVELASD